MDRLSEWPGAPARVVFANLDSSIPVEREPGQSSALVRRAGLIATSCQIVVGYEEALGFSGGRWTEVPVQFRGGDLCDDFTWDDTAQHRLSDFLANHPPPSAIWAQVYSPAMDTLSFELEGWGVDRRLLPDCSGTTVAHWNSKVGGAELLRRAVGSACPATSTCHGVEHLRRLLNRSSRPWVIKADHAMGGVGMSVIHAGATDEQLARALALAAGQSTDPGVITARASAEPKPKPIKSAPFEGDGVVVQQFVGDLERNISPTADFWVGPAGVKLVALADQVLTKRGRYIGSRSPCDEAHRARNEVHRLGESVGLAMRDEGYRGLVNIDFVVSPEGEVWVVEVNVRQSAPLDQSLMMSRRFGWDWRSHFRYEAREPGYHDTLEGDHSEAILYCGKAEEALLLAIFRRNP